MTFALALLLAATPQSSPALDTALLAAFDRHCATLDSADALATRIGGAGWAEFTPAADSDLGRLVNYSNGAKNEIPGFVYQSRTFAPAGDSSLVAIVTRAGPPGMMSLECRVVALGATAAPSAATVDGWAKRKADRAMNEAGIQIWQWKPGLRETHQTTGLVYVDKASPARGRLPLLGLAAQAMREGER